MPEAAAPKRKLRIAIVSAFYSEGMGYSENCLSRALARLGHDVHVITSTYNVYGNEPLYDATYRDFLGPSKVAPGTRSVDGYEVHRLESHLVSGYVRMRGMNAKIRELAPDIVHSIEIASLQTFELAPIQPFLRFKLFCETHQAMSVVKPYMLQPHGSWFRKAVYRATRTLPSFLSSLVVERVYAVAEVCVDVAVGFYGVPRSKVKLLLLGTDTDLFHPVETDADAAARLALRTSLGFSADDIVCVYTGRFTRAKNPLLLAQAIHALNARDPRFKGLFIGKGEEGESIAATPGCRCLPFMRHQGLSEHYRAADIAVWPKQESMSMLDAAACGLPVVVSDKIGDPGRVAGNGRMYEEDSASSLARVLAELAPGQARRPLALEGRRRMVEDFSWMRFARAVEADFMAAVSGRQ